VNNNKTKQIPRESFPIGVTFPRPTQECGPSSESMINAPTRQPQQEREKEKEKDSVP